MDIRNDIKEIVKNNGDKLNELTRLNQILERTRVELELLDVMEERSLDKAFHNPAVSTLMPDGTRYVAMGHLLFSAANKQAVIDLMRKQAKENWAKYIVKFNELRDEFSK